MSCCFYRQTKRLVESKNIFETIVNLKYLSSIAFILFLNKTDLLATKLSEKHSNICHYFPEYKVISCVLVVKDAFSISWFQGDPFDLSQVQSFILEMFVSTRKNPNQGLYHHFTTAIDTENVNKVFGAVKHFILEKHLERLMIQ